MAEGFEVYHVPQQSRRDKLRVGIGNNTHNNNNNYYFDHHNYFDFQNPSFQLHHTNNYPPTADVPPLLSDPQPLSLELNLQQRYASSAAAAAAVVFSSTPHDSGLPLVGYSASLLKGSKFFKPAQQLLDDLFHYDAAGPNNSDDFPPDSALLLDPLLQTLGEDIPTTVAAVDQDPIDDGTESRRKKSRLITMLDEVYRRYKLYYQQMQAVVTTFEYAAGLGNAAPYVNLAIKAMFKHFRFLKNAIADQLQFNKQQQPYNPYCQRSIHNNNNSVGFLDHQPVWRPQRGLPESAVTVLRAWLFEHFLHPYPTDTDKLMLANQTGLSRSQVSNWFINARVRLWKPMVEEIHMLETRQAQKSQHRESNNNNNNNNNNNGNALNNTNNNDESLKAEHNNASSSNHDHHQQHHPLNLSNSNFFPTHHPHAAAGAATMGGGNNNVSLTLGLHQNHGGITLTEPFPINAAQHFNLGLEANGEGFVNEWF